MRILLILAALSVTANAAPVPKELRHSPLDKFQGEWVLVSLETADGLFGAQQRTVLTIRGGKGWTTSDNFPGQDGFGVEFDTKSEPVKMTTNGGKGTTLRWIVKVEAGKLYWCRNNDEDADPPKEFRVGSKTHCFIYKRVRE